MISGSKPWKILKVQKLPQKASRSLYSRVMSKFPISIFGNLRAITPPENGSHNFLVRFVLILFDSMKFCLIYVVFDENSSPLPRNLVFFQIKCNQKTMISGSKTRKILKIQKRPQKADNSSLYSRVMSKFTISIFGNLRVISPAENGSKIS